MNTCNKFGIEHKRKIVNSKLNIKLQNIFATLHTPNWWEKVFLIKKVKTLYDGHTLLVISMVKSCRRPVKKNSGLEKKS